MKRSRVRAHGAQLLAGAAFIIVMFLTHSAPVIAEVAESKLFENATLTADELRAAMATYHRIVLRDVVVEGFLIIPSEMEALSGEDVTFAGRVEADYSERETTRDIELNFARFEEPVNLSFSTWRQIFCSECVFEQDVTMAYVRAENLQIRDSRFVGRLDLARSNVEALGLFNVSLEDGGDLTGATATSLGTAGLTSREPIEVEWSFFGDKWFEAANDRLQSSEPSAQRYAALEIEADFRFWRQNFDRLGRESDVWLVNRQLALFHRDHFLRPTDASWWTTAAIDITTGYGTAPYRIFLLSFLAIVIFGVAYLGLGAVQPAGDDMPAPSRVLFALVYSLETFVPLVRITSRSTWNWEIDEHYNALVMLETLLGIVASVIAGYSLRYIL
jgi:hypothetical protein